MSIEKIIKSRRTIHDFKKDKIEEEILLQALELASYAPNHKLTFPWVFIDVGPESRKVLANAEAEIKSKKTNMDVATLLRGSLEKFLGPAHLLLVGIKKTNDPVQMKEDYATLSASLQNMALFLWSHNIGTKWSTGKITQSESAYKIANLNATEYELCGFFWVGVPAQIPEVSQRPPVSAYFRRIN